MQQGWLLVEGRVELPPPEKILEANLPAGFFTRTTGFFLGSSHTDNNLGGRRS